MVNFVLKIPSELDLDHCSIQKHPGPGGGAPGEVGREGAGGFRGVEPP